MTQSLPPSISLETLSTELPVAWDVAPVANGSSQLSPDSQPLVLFPGRRGELLVRSHNHGDRPLELQLVVQGNFPRQWFPSQTGASEPVWSETLAPHASLSDVLTFEIPEDFFEQDQALAHEKALELRYQGELYLYASVVGDDRRRLAGYQVIDLYVRPDPSYIDFLPEIYQQSDFLSRFLTIFEEAFDPTVQTLDLFWAYLDPLTAPKALLPFLAEWVAWPLNPRWTLKQQRRLIRHAIEIYQWRGTRHGLRLALSLVTGLPNDDDHITIRDDHQADFVLGDITLGDGASLGGGRPFHFLVTLHADTTQGHPAIDETLVRAIIDQEKPAFCTYDLEIMAAS